MRRKRCKDRQYQIYQRGQSISNAPGREEGLKAAARAHSYCLKNKRSSGIRLLDRAG
jgi:hypothetical protein